MGAARYVVRYPATPGATPSGQPAATLTEARKIAKSTRSRRDLVGQDVRIELVDGRLVEYAGPCR